MDNPRDEKVAVVTEVRERFEHASAAILTEYRGLTVKDLAALRRTLRDAGSEYKIYKNTLVRFAARDAGLDELESLLVGPTAIAFVDGDAAAVAKALRDYARTNPKLTVKGGVLGKRIISVADATALADLPPREVVLARFAGALASPLQTFAGLLQALPRSFAYGLKALIEKRGGPEAVEAAAAAASEGADAAEAGGAGTPSEAPSSTDADAADAAGAGSTAEAAAPAGTPSEAPAPAASEGFDAAEAAGAGSTAPAAAPAESDGGATAPTEPAESAVSATTSEPPPAATATSEPAESAVSPAPTEATALADHNVSDPGITLAASETEPEAAEGSPQAYDQTRHPSPAPASEDADGDAPPEQ